MKSHVNDVILSPRKTYMAYRKKYKALILKQVPCILKYMACIFRLSKYLKYNMVENDVFERSAAWQKGENHGRFPWTVAQIGGSVPLT